MDLLEKELAYIRSRVDYLVAEVSIIKAELAVLQYKTNRAATLYGLIGGAIPSVLMLIAIIIQGAGQ